MARILIAEDDRLCAEDVKRCLELSGHHVMGIAPGGEQALELARVESPDLVVMDVSLRGQMDGVTAARTLQREHDVPVVYLTGYGDQQTYERAKLTAPHGFIVKPYDDRTLRATVDLALLQSGVEKELASRGGWLAALLSSISAGVIATDERGVVRYVNDEARRLTGVSTPEGTPVSTLVRFVANHVRRPIPEPIAQALRTKQSVQLPFDAALATGDDDVPVEGAAAPIRNALGGQFGAVLVFRDVANQRHAEQERLRAQRFESLGLLAGGIAHDFNNMLMTIVASATLARSTKEPAEYLDEITAQCERAAALTRQLLDIARAGTLARSAVDINDLLRSTASLALRGSATRCQFDLDANLARVHGDAGQLAQLLTNLVLNARQAMAGQGTVTIRSGNLTVEGDSLPLEVGDYVKIEVEDTGVGIPVEHIEHVFDPYFTTREQGSGLGLTSAFAIARRHAGHLSIRSTEDVGTVVSLYLPAADVTVSEAPPASANDSELLLGSGRVLLMDDETSLRRLLADCITELGYDVQTVTRGEEALEAYRRALEAGEPYDTVLLDLTIRNGMGGADTLRALLTLDPDVRAIAMTGYEHGPEALDWREEGFVELLPKPFRFASLARALRTAFESPRPHTRALLAAGKGTG